MWLTLLITNLVIFIIILIIFYWICKKKTKIVEIEEPKTPFTIKLDKIKKRLGKIRNQIK